MTGQERKETQLGGGGGGTQSPGGPRGTRLEVTQLGGGAHPEPTEAHTSPLGPTWYFKPSRGEVALSSSGGLSPKVQGSTAV